VAWICKIQLFNFNNSCFIFDNKMYMHFRVFVVDNFNLLIKVCIWSISFFCVPTTCVLRMVYTSLITRFMNTISAGGPTVVIGHSWLMAFSSCPSINYPCQLFQHARQAKAVKMGAQGAWTTWNTTDRKLTWRDISPSVSTIRPSVSTIRQSVPHM